jgi:hypothetical protein
MHMRLHDALRGDGRITEVRAPNELGDRERRYEGQ